MMTRASLGLVFLPRAYKDLFGPVLPHSLLTARHAPPARSSDA
jgi:hypothetical protein